MDRYCGERNREIGYTAFHSPLDLLAAIERGTQFDLLLLEVLLLSNEKYTGRVLLQKTVSIDAVQIENDGFMDRYPYTDTHEAIISDEMFMAVQQEKLGQSKEPQNHVAMKLLL